MISKFIEYLTVERNYSLRTTTEYERDLQEFCSFLQVGQTDFDPASVTVADVRYWLISMLESGLSPRSIRRKLSALRSYYKYLLRIGLVTKDVTQAVIAPKVDKPLPVFFKETEMNLATRENEAADDFVSVRNCLIVEILYETGMRQAELLGLNDGDIDLGQQQIRVFGKRKKVRIIPFGDNLAQLITRYMTYRAETFNMSTSPDQPFFLGKKGRRLTKTTLYSVVCERMGEVSTLTKHSPHVLRHTFATTMLNSGADINTIKTLLGHASLAATQVYTHTTFAQIQDVYKKSHPRENSRK